MIGSSYDGEALAAARMADSLIRESGLTWQLVLKYDSIAEDAARQLLAENEVLRCQAVTDRQIIARYAGAHEELHAANEELHRQIRAHEEWRAARYSSPVDPLSLAVEKGLLTAITCVPFFGMIVFGIVYLLSIR